MNQQLPGIKEIRTAAERIKPYAHITPVYTSKSINRRAGCSLWFKCENLQKAGAFKFRGACNAVFSLTDEQSSCGVITHSSGNHGQAISLAAQLRNIPAWVVMPSNSARIKIEAVKEYGAEVIFCEPTQSAREFTAEKLIKKTGAHFIHPFNDTNIIAGQATAALELLEEVPRLETIIVPVGGGGLLGGTAIAAKNLNPGLRVVGAEPEKADDAFRSFHSGKLVQPDSTDTIADGLRTSLGELTFAAIHRYVNDIVTVPEDSIIRGMRTVMERMKMVIEPSSAVALAALLDGKISTPGCTGIILTGGNVDLDHLPWAVSS